VALKTVSLLSFLDSTMTSKRLCFVSADGERFATLEASEEALIADLLEAVLVELHPSESVVEDAAVNYAFRWRGQLLPPQRTVRELALPDDELITVEPQFRNQALERAQTTAPDSVRDRDAALPAPISETSALPATAGVSGLVSRSGSDWTSMPFEDELMSPELQRRIEAAIHEHNIQENLAAALEHNVESFTYITPLYVRVRVTADSARNAQPVLALVDSGAQCTVMSQACAERSGLSRLIDRRFRGTAIGLGRAEFIGRVHMALMELDGEWYECSFAIVEQLNTDMLLGLDTLRKHGMCIDLRENVLRERDRAVPFLSDREIAEARGLDSAPARNETDVNVQRLVAMGFDEASARSALAAANGNLGLAAALLMRPGIEAP
jgi:hypothetical protein